jgi:hypothetical protein
MIGACSNQNVGSRKDAGRFQPAYPRPFEAPPILGTRELKVQWRRRRLGQYRRGGGGSVDAASHLGGTWVNGGGVNR